MHLLKLHLPWIAKLTKLYTDSCKQSVETFCAATETVIQDNLHIKVR